MLLFEPRLSLQLAQLRLDERRLSAAGARLAQLARPGPRRGIRRSIGRSLVRLGVWLAADTHLEPARSR